MFTKKPVIKVWCLPLLPEARLNELFQTIVHVVENVDALGLKGEKAMIVLFPRDMMQYGLGTEVVIEVTGLLGRTSVVRNKLAKSLGDAVKDYFPKAFVQCSIHDFNPADGFWSSES